MSERLRAALRPPRKLLFTQDGRWFTGMTLLVGVGAINTGNNLLYLLLGMMLGLVVVSGIQSERSLKKVSVRRLPVGDLFAGRTSRLPYEVTNAKRRLASHSLIIEEHESRETRAARRLTIGLPRLRPRRRKHREKEADPGGPKALVVRVPSRCTQVVHAEYVFPRRGLYSYVGIDLGTRFPFGFFEKSRDIREAQELLVYPEVSTGSVRLQAVEHREGEVQRAAEGRSGEFFGLREYREGDDLRDVHWKVTARRGTLVRRLYERHDDEAVAVHLYNWAPPSAQATEGLALDDAEREALAHVERAISDTASLCAWLAERGRRFSLHTIDEVVAEGSGPGQLHTALRHLALVEVRRDRRPPQLALSAHPNRALVDSIYAPEALRARFDQVTQRGGAQQRLGALEEAA